MNELHSINYQIHFSFFEMLVVVRIIQRKLLRACLETFMSLGTEGLWMRKDMSGLLEDLMI